MATPSVFSFGIIIGGTAPALEPAIDELRGFLRGAHELFDGHAGGGLRMNVVFHIPGHLVQPDYVGVHVSRYDRKRQLMLAVSAVPNDLQAEDVSAFVAYVLRSARLRASEYLGIRHISVDTADLDAAIDRILTEFVSR
jgi:hypothetical protein